MQSKSGSSIREQSLIEATGRKNVVFALPSNHSVFALAKILDQAAMSIPFCSGATPPIHAAAAANMR